MRSLDCKLVFISLCLLHLLSTTGGRPVRKRTVSEVQLMHNLREHRQLQERRDWLQSRLRGIHTAPGRRADAARRRNKLFPVEEMPELSKLSSDEMQQLLERLLNATQA